MAKTKQNKEEKMLTCLKCGKTFKRTGVHFFKSNKTEYDSIGHFCNICKSCLREECYTLDGLISISGVKTVLQYLDKPFLWELFNKVNSDRWDLGTYSRQLNTSQYKNMTFKDSDADEYIIKEQQDNDYEKVKEENNVDSNDYDLEYLQGKWGFGYEKDELVSFEKKYLLLKNNYPEKTAMHTEALQTYIRYRVKEEMATAKGDFKEAKAWGDLASKAAQDAKINPSQLSRADLTDGLSTFGELIRAVEQAVDIIPILPQFKEKPQDKPDFTIWCYVNYIRDLKGLPMCEYKDIYQFYEERKKEYQKHASHEDDKVFKTEELESDE